MSQYQKLNIDELILWKDNARYSKTLDTEEECLEELFGDKIMRQKQKVLLTDIFFENDIIENCIVYKEEIDEAEYQYIVLDGNRRISLFKVSNYPELVSKYNLDDLKLSNIKDKVKNVDCKVYDDLNQAYRHVELRHLDEQKGRGTVKWASENKDRMREIQDKEVESIGYKIMKFYETTLKPEFQEVKKVVRDKSTLDRIFGYKNTYNGIFGLNNKYEYDLYNSDHQTKINDILEKFYSVGGKVTQVYTAEQTKKLFEDVEALPENKNQMTLDEIVKQNDEKISNSSGEEQSLKTPNKYTIKGANLFNWTNKGISSGNDLFNYYFKKIINIKYISQFDQDLILDITPYLYRLLLDIAIIDLSNFINTSKGNSLLKSSFSRAPFNTTTIGVSGVNPNKITNILRIYDNLKNNEHQKQFNKYKTILNSKQFTVKNDKAVTKFVQDLNDVVHGSSKTLSSQLLEKYDIITITLLQSIYNFINLK